MTGGLLLLLTCLGCMALSLRLGRRVVAAREAPLLAERVQQLRGVMIIVAISAVGIQPLLRLLAGGSPASMQPTFLLEPDVLLAFLPVSLALLVGYYPTRRVIYGETWGLGAYVAYTIRVAVALGGPWALLAFGPYVGYLVGSEQPWPGVVLLAVLAGWWVFFGAITAALLDGAAIDSAGMSERLARVVAASDLDGVEARAIGPDGGGWMAVFALPTARPPAIFVSRPLLQRLDAEAVAALFAREVARLEESVRRPRLRWSMGAVIVAAAIAEPLFASWSIEASRLFRWLWLPCFAIALVCLALRQARRESVLDLRAAELLGGAPTGAPLVARALTALFEGNLIPSRQAGAAVTGMSVPSLDDRLDTLAAAASSRAVAAAEGAAGAGADRTTAETIPTRMFRAGGESQDLLIIDDSGIRILRGVEGAELPESGATDLDVDHLCGAAREARHTRYEDMRFALLKLGRKGPQVVIVDRRTMGQAFPIETESIEAVRELLGRVERRLRAAGALHGGAFSRGSLLSFLAAVSAFVVSWSGALPIGGVMLLLVSTVVFMLLRRRTWLAANGAVAISMAAAPFLVGNAALISTPVDWLCLSAVFGGGIGCLWTVFRSGPSAADSHGTLPTGGPRLTAAIFGALSVPLVLDLAFAGEPGSTLLRIIAISRGTNGVWTSLVAAGAALAVGGARFRTAALALLAAGFAPALFGSDWFVVTSAADGFVTEMPAVVERSGRGRILADVRLDEPIDGLWVAPGGDHFATIVAGGLDHHHHSPDEASEHAHPFMAAVYSDSAEIGRLEVYALTFASAEHLLLLAGEASAPELRLVALADLDEVLSRIPLHGAELADHTRLLASNGRWRLEIPGREAFLVHSGGVDTRDYSTRRWPTPNGEDAAHVAVDAPLALELSWGADRRGPGLSAQRFLWVLGPKYWTVRASWVHEGNARDAPARVAATSNPSASWVECLSPSDVTGDILCLARGRNHGWIWRAKAGDGTLTPQARTTTALRWAWTGEQLMLLRDHDLLVVEPGSTSARRFPLPQRASWDVQMAARRDTVALAWPDGESGSRISILDVHGSGSAQEAGTSEMGWIRQLSPASYSWPSGGIGRELDAGSDLVAGSHASP